MASGVAKPAAADQAPRKRRGRTIKACEGCRALKTRCQFSGASLVCDKCIELNRPCTMLPATGGPPRPVRKRRASTKQPPGSTSAAGPGPASAGAVPMHDRRASIVSQLAVSSTDGSELEFETSDLGVDVPRIVDPPIDPMHAPVPVPTLASAPASASAAGAAAAPSLSTLTGMGYGYGGHSLPGRMSTSRSASEQIMGDDALFDPRFPGFDMRAALDPETFVPEPSPLASEDFEIPSLLDPEFPELFLGMDALDAALGQPESPEVAQNQNGEQTFTTNPRNRIRFRFSPMYMALRQLDPSLQSGYGIASRLLKPRSAVPTPTRNVISQGVLSRSHAIELIDVFRIHLNHWLLIPVSSDTGMMIDQIMQRCPLLITVLCAVAMRLCSRDSWSRHYPAIVDYMSKELSITLARSPQSVESLQAIMILALYGSSLSYQDYVFDMWYLSGIGVQHCMTSTALLDTMAHHHLALWNHLVHVHMHCTVMTGRLPMIDDQCVELCRRILKEPFADRFDSCILTEILIYDIAMQVLRSRITYDEFTKKVDEWRNEWSLVLSMTTVQFSDTVRHLLEFTVRISHLRRLSQTSPSPASAATLVDNYIMPVALNHERVGFDDDLLTAQWLDTLPTTELVTGLAHLSSCISGIILPATGRLFRYLSDLIHDVAFTAAVLAVTIRKILLKRHDVAPEADGIMEDALMLPRRLAELYHATSRGPDMQQSRCFALVRLLQGVN